jgi:OOP family OmpA-OmpF porin
MAQFGNLVNRAKNKVDQSIDRKIDKAIDAEINGAPQEKKTETAQAQKPATVQPAATEQAPALSSFSKYDFVQGEKLVYAEDFTQDEMGELPLDWNTNGKAEVVTINTLEGKWLRIYQNALYLTANKDSFSKNFTVEFDAVFRVKTNGWLFPSFSFGFFASKDLPANDNSFLRDFNENAAVQTWIRLSEGGNTSTSLESYAEKKKVFYSENQNLASIEAYYSKPTHVSMQVQDKRIRIWFNGEKKFDIPMAVPAGYSYNQVFFRLSPSNYKDDMLSFFIGNIRIASGKPDARHKLIDEGKFSTTGILFDNQSAVVKQESWGVIRELATLLKENKGIRIRIIGHTSSDGDDADHHFIIHFHTVEFSAAQVAASFFFIDEHFQVCPTFSWFFSRLISCCTAITSSARRCFSSAGTSSTRSWAVVFSSWE